MRAAAAFCFSAVMAMLLCPAGYAQTPATPPVPPALAQVGVSAAVRGAVTLTRPGVVGHAVQSGEPIYLGDEIATQAGGHLQIILLDETVFTIGPDSTIVIDKFIYDPATDAGEVGVRTIKGVFRFITGKIARKDPSNMEVKLPAGVIGIRGTIAAGRVNGNDALVVLLGPGERNNTGDRPGSLSVRTVKDNPHVQEVIITRPGYGTTITDPNLPPTPPALVPPATLDALNQDLAPPTGSPTTDPTATNGASATTDAGQTTAGALDDVSTTTSVTQVADGLGDEVTGAAQDSADEANANSEAIATVAQLNTVPTGVYFFGASGVFVQTVKDGSPVAINGTIQTDVEINFGSRTVGGGNSNLDINTLSFGGNIQRNEVIEAQPFSNGAGGLAVYSDVSGDGKVTGTIKIRNSAGIVGATADLIADFLETTPALNVGNASIERVPRATGPAP